MAPLRRDASGRPCQWHPVVAGPDGRLPAGWLAVYGVREAGGDDGAGSEGDAVRTSAVGGATPVGPCRRQLVVRGGVALRGLAVPARCMAGSRAGQGRAGGSAQGHGSKCAWRLLALTPTVAGPPRWHATAATITRYLRQALTRSPDSATELHNREEGCPPAVQLRVQHPDAAGSTAAAAQAHASDVGQAEGQWVWASRLNACGCAGPLPHHSSRLLGSASLRRPVASSYPRTARSVCSSPRLW